MYDFDVSISQSNSAAEAAGNLAMKSIARYCPKGSPVLAPTSTLAKLLTWCNSQPVQQSERLLQSEISYQTA